MILLDTDHFSILQHADDPRAIRLRARLDTTPDSPIGTTIITFEEQVRGWLARINRERDPVRQAGEYGQLLRLAEMFRTWHIQAYDVAAANEYIRLRRARIRVGTQDLKIASIALTSGALLLTANLRDYQLVPGLRVENWVHVAGAAEG